MNRATATAQHLTSVEVREVGTDGMASTGCCTCGWRGPERPLLITAQDDTTRHLLEAQS